MFGTLLGGIVAIGVAAKVVGFICDQMTEAEREQQRGMREDYEIYKSQRESDLEVINANKYKDIDSILQSHKETETTFLREHQIRQIEARKRIVESFNKMVEERIQDRKELLSEIKMTLESVFKAKKSQNTMLRLNALDQLIRELQEAIEKLKSYIEYLKKYQKRLVSSYNLSSDLPEPFEFTLPETFPYKGKLMYWKKSNISERGSITVNGIRDIYYICDDIESFDDMEDDTLVPIMADFFKGKPDYAWTFSIRKGIFKNTVINNPKLGVTTEVTKYTERGNISLCYDDTIEMELPKKHLQNPKRIPLIGAKIRVFPLKWSYSLDDRKPMIVSEKSSDCLLNYNFSDIPVIFSNENWAEFENYLNKHSLLDSDSEWKIAPFDETDIPNVEKVKLQLGTELVFSAHLQTSNEGTYFLYESLLDDVFRIKAEDIFIAIDCTLNVVLDSDFMSLDDDTYENMNDLTIMVYNEFKLQHQTKLSQEGMQFFNKWSEITDQLITYLYKGKSVELNIDVIEKEEFIDKRIDGYSYRVYFKNINRVEAFLDKVYETAFRKWSVEFFIEMEKGVYASAEFSQDCEYIRLYGDGVENFINGNKLDAIRIFNKQYAYAEFQQNAALHAFRVGKMANAKLQVCALDGKHMAPVSEEFLIDRFYNKQLPNDNSQKEAVERALDEKNIFMIQGPPGTGKTTVIREIVMQYIKNKFNMNILIVSQANVAVDNVLRGFLNKLPDDMIRCGNTDRISPDIAHVSFDEKYNNYVNKMKAKVGGECNQDILENWMQIVNPENGYNPDIGELIMKGNRIIGATCVGLAKKRIGLDRMEFDLVIIDEAGKALPAEILIPYNKAKKVILIGDHKQLPPVVNPALLDNKKIEMDDRDIFEDQLFGESFFNRMFERAPDSNKCMLETQYRMPRLIGSLISELFYDGNLKNGTVTNSKLPFYFNSNLTLIDMSKEFDYQEDSSSTKSVTNIREAEYVSDLVSKIRESISKDQARIAVITPYKGQKRLLIEKLKESKLNPKGNNIEINTVDAFQGDEAEIVIYCTTRAVKPTRYFSDYRRVNVALSRAKNELIVIGSRKYFYKYRDEPRVLPRIADYIEKYGSIIDPITMEKINTANVAVSGKLNS